MWVGLLTDRISNKLKKEGHLINEHALNREPVALRHDNLIIAGFQCHAIQNRSK